MSLPILASVVVALACGGGDSTSPSLETGVIDTARIKLNYMCGNTFRARNYNNASVSVTWDVVGTTEQGTLVLPPKPAGEGFSTTLFTPAHLGTVRLLYQGQVLQSKENEGGPACPAVPVGLQPPDSVPAWFYDDTSYAQPGGYLKRVLWVIFRDGATESQRSEAVLAVGGVLVGGLPGYVGEGYYYLLLPSAASQTELEAAKATLDSMPQVEAVDLLSRGGHALYRKPVDGPDFRRADWAIASERSQGVNWALEAINAPYAWGCSTGGPNVRIGVLDHRFEPTEIAYNVGGGARELGRFPSNSSHGTAVASVIAARGNDSVGMTGLMWAASLQLRDFERDTVQWPEMMQLIDSLAMSGTKVINLSFGRDWAVGETLDSSEVKRDSMRSAPSSGSSLGAGRSHLSCCRLATTASWMHGGASCPRFGTAFRTMLSSSEAVTEVVDVGRTPVRGT